LRVALSSRLYPALQCSLQRMQPPSLVIPLLYKLMDAV
jgi:hypothetical protein